jgi:hypothetical protein
MSPGERCDEILLIVDDALSGLPRPSGPRSGKEAAARMGTLAGCQRAGSTQRRGQPTQTGSSGANASAFG